MFENEKKEDYMGMVSWHRNMGTPKTLFGTEIQSNPITLTIKRATECRELSRNWYHSDKQLVEIEMSPIQWAEFLTNGNTDGVPCTIVRVEGKQMSEPKVSEIAKQYNQEVEESFDRFDNSFKEIADIIKSTLNENKSMGKRQMEEILHMIDNARHKVVADAKYVKSSFKEDMEEMVTKAKAEFNAYVENRIYEIGVDTIKKDAVKFLEHKEE